MTSFSNSFSQKPLRVGIDVRLWSESGVGRYTKNLVLNLAKIDSKNDYFLFSLQKNISEIQAKIPNSKFKIIKADIRWHSLDEQLKFPKILNKYNLDLTHFPYFSIPIYYKKPFVATIHDLIIDHYPTGKASTLPLPIYKIKQIGYKKVLRRAISDAKAIITVSNATKEEIVGHYKATSEKIIVTYEGVEDFAQSSKLESGDLVKEYNLQPKNFLLYVGNAYPHKNLDRLIQAFKKMNKKDFYLVLVGKEDFFYKKLKASNSNKNIVFLGEVSDIDLSYLYKNAKALVAPSLMEGFGLPVLEAMQNKCPVIVSDIPVFHEICQNTATYFNPLEMDDIKEKLQKVCFGDLSNDNKKVEKGFEIASEFSWEKMAKETLKVYESCVSIR